MYPLRDSQLPLSSIAHEWARELTQRPSEDAVMNHLLTAVWQGDLVVRLPSTGEPMTPEALLRIVASTKNHPGIEIAEQGETRFSSSTELPDGSVEIDFHVIIVLPNDSEQWTSEQERTAIDMLSHRGRSDFSAGLRIAISMLDVTRDEFASYCTSAGFPLPTFWFGKRPTEISKAKPERECSDWLRSLAKGSKEHAKIWYCEEARLRFPGLSARGFERAWKRGVPKSWKGRGARRKRRVLELAP